MIDAIHLIVNIIRENKGDAPIAGLTASTRLRMDLGFDSLDLAELTVRIEKETGIDVFADGFVNTVGEILEKIEGK